MRPLVTRRVGSAEVQGVVRGDGKGEKGVTVAHKHEVHSPSLAETQQIERDKKCFGLRAFPFFFLFIVIRAF